MNPVTYTVCAILFKGQTLKFIHKFYQIVKASGSTELTKFYFLFHGYLCIRLKILNAYFLCVPSLPQLLCLLLGSLGIPVHLVSRRTTSPPGPVCGGLWGGAVCSGLHLPQ